MTLSNSCTSLERNRWLDKCVIFTACLPSLIHCSAVPDYCRIADSLELDKHASATHFAGTVAGAPFSFTKNTRNLASLVVLAFREPCERPPEICSTSDPARASLLSRLSSASPPPPST